LALSDRLTENTGSSAIALKSDDSKAIFAWAMYDWANSAFATTVMAAFFPIFFKKFWSLGTDPVVSTAKLGMVNSLAGIVVALSAPLLGAVASCSLSMSG
jgi:UMF1 family MFS transporter